MPLHKQIGFTSDSDTNSSREIPVQDVVPEKGTRKKRGKPTKQKPSHAALHEQIQFTSDSDSDTMYKQYAEQPPTKAAESQIGACSYVSNSDSEDSGDRTPMKPSAGQRKGFTERKGPTKHILVEDSEQNSIKSYIRKPHITVPESLECDTPDESLPKAAIPQSYAQCYEVPDSVVQDTEQDTESNGGKERNRSDLCVADSHVSDSESLCQGRVARAEARITIPDSLATDSESLSQGRAGRNKVKNRPHLTVSDSLVPDTESQELDQVLRKHRKHKNITVPDSLVTDSESLSQGKLAKAQCQVTVPESLSMDEDRPDQIRGRSDQKSQATADIEHLVPDSMSEETRSSTSSARYSIQSVPESLVPESVASGSSESHLTETSYVIPDSLSERSEDTELQHPSTVKKRTSQKKNIFAEIAFSSDSSDGDIEPTQFVQTYNVQSVRQDTRTNSSSSSNTSSQSSNLDMTLADMSNRLAKVLSIQTDKKGKKRKTKKSKGKETFSKGGVTVVRDSEDIAKEKAVKVDRAKSSIPETDSSPENVALPKSQHMYSHARPGIENKENVNSKVQKKTKKIKVKQRPNIFEQFKFSSDESDKETGNATGNNASTAAGNPVTFDMDVTVIDDLSQRMSKIWSQQSKKNRTKKRKNVPQMVEIPESPEQTVSNKDGDVKSRDEHVRNMSLQVSFSDVSSPEANPSIDSQPDIVMDVPPSGRKDMSLQVSMMGSEGNQSEFLTSDEDHEHFQAPTEKTGICESKDNTQDEQSAIVSSADLALQVSLASENESLDEPGLSQDAQQDSLMTNGDTANSSNATNSSSYSAGPYNATVFETPPEELPEAATAYKTARGKVAHRNISFGSQSGSPALQATVQGDNVARPASIQKASRESTGSQSGSFCDQGSAGRENDAAAWIPKLIMSDSGDENEEAPRKRVSCPFTLCCGQLCVRQMICGQTCDGLYHFAFYLVNYGIPYGSRTIRPALARHTGVQVPVVPAKVIT